jgi:hypothetical protein
MKQGLLLDGVYMGCAGKLVYKSIERALPVLPYAAKSSFTGRNNTVLPAKITMDLMVFTFFVKRCFFHPLY